MRSFGFVIACALVACGGKSPASGPSNKAAATDYGKTAEDELGFLPADADMVVGVDMVKLRSSMLWQKYEPKLIGMVQQQMQKMGGACNDDKLIKSIQRLTFSAKQRGNDMDLVLVVRGIDTATITDCVVKDANQRGGKAVVDRGVVLINYPDMPNLTYAAATVGATTLVVEARPGATYDSVQGVLRSGTPLRQSTTFMSLYSRREPTASIWGMANGNAEMFNEMASMGMRPKSLDGTLSVSDKFSGTLRMTMGSPDEAAKMGAELDKLKGPIGAMVERFETHAQGDMVATTVVMTEPQLRSLIGLMGGMGGP